MSNQSLHRFAFVAALLCLVTASAHAGALDQLQTFAAGTQSATGDFTQRIVRNGEATSTASPAVASSGTFAFSRPGKFRWVYQKPYDQTLVADGEKLWMYDRDLNQVTVRKLGTALGESPAAILFGSNDLAKKFDLKEAGRRDGLEWLDALPKSRESTFQMVSIGFKDGLPLAMELRDAFGQLSVLNFRNLVRNPPMPADRFSFEPPKGADVFQQ